MNKDDKKFIRARDRMCGTYPDCSGCPAHDFNDCKAFHLNERMVPVVEEWVKEHPAETRQSEFLKQYPDADISDDGLPAVAPCQLCVGLIHGESTEDCENRGLCVECRREFWMQEVE